MSEAESHQRLAGGGNSIAFLAAHLTDTRHFLASRLGNPLHNPLSLYLDDAGTIDDIRACATVDQVRAAWISISAHLLTTLDGLSSDDLSRTDAGLYLTQHLAGDGRNRGFGLHLAYQHGRLGNVPETEKRDFDRVIGGLIWVP